MWYFLKVSQFKILQTSIYVRFILVLITHSLLILFPIPQLPPLSGPYPISFIDQEWTDPIRPEWIPPFSKSTLPRPLFIRFWYPAIIPADTHLIRKPYFPHVHIRGPAQAKEFNIPGFIISHFSLTGTHALFSKLPNGQVEPLPPYPGRHPLITFSHGFSGSFDQNTVLMEDLVSKGYIVVSMDHTFDATCSVHPTIEKTFNINCAIPDDVIDRVKEGHIDSLFELRHRQLNARMKDCDFVINQIKEKKEPAFLVPYIDTSSIIAMGHSFGGATATALSLHQDLKLIIGLDTWTFTLPQSIKENGTKA